MEIGFCDLLGRQIQVVQAFLDSLWCGNLDDLPLKSSTIHSSQMLFQSLTTLIGWELPQNPILPQPCPSPQLYQSCLLSLWSQCKSYFPFSKASLSSSFTLKPSPSCFLSDLASSRSLCHLHINGLISLLYLKGNKINNLSFSLVYRKLSFPSQPSLFQMYSYSLSVPLSAHSSNLYNLPSLLLLRWCHWLSNCQI